MAAFIDRDLIAAARTAAIEILVHNIRGPYEGLPRTAGWGYPEPYTRDIMLSSLGYLVSGEPCLVNALERCLVRLAENQTPRGHIPSMIHDPENRGASDTTPLFLFGLALFRLHSGRPDFLDNACQRALVWMQYQSPDDLVMVAQLPTSDWRDEQSVTGYGLYVNTLVYACLRLLEKEEDADLLSSLMNRLEVKGAEKEPHVHEGLSVPDKPYYALYSYKLFNSDRFDLLGNSLAVLSGIASPSRSKQMISWIEAECAALRGQGDLKPELPPALIPYILEGDPDWRERYRDYNLPGEYHNGGIWPFIEGFYVAACVAAGEQELAEQKLMALTRLVALRIDTNLDWGFNEWIKAQTGDPRGQEWQTWSAALYLYAVECVETKSTPFFDLVRGEASRP